MIDVSFVISYVIDFSPNKYLNYSRNIEKLANDQRVDSDQIATRIIGHNSMSRFDKKVKWTSKCARLYEIPRLANRHKRLNNGDAIERHYYFPSRTIYGQSSRDTTQQRHIDLIRSIVTLYNYANRLSLIKLVKATLGKQVSR